MSEQSQPQPNGRVSRWIGAKAQLRALWGATATVWDSLVGRLDKASMDTRFQTWCQSLLDDAEATIVVGGAEYIRNGAIYMSNHVSVYDIPVVGSLVPGVRMIAKAEIFKIPIWGRALRVAGFIAIDRRNRESAIVSLKRAADQMRQGVNIWMAPEGTRSRDGNLLPFKKGGFIMAIEMGATIIPMTIEGTFELVPPKSVSVRLGQTVHVRFHPPIDASRYTLDERDALMAEVQAVIAERPAATVIDAPGPTAPAG